MQTFVERPHADRHDTDWFAALAMDTAFFLMVVSGTVIAIAIAVAALAT
jgi:hypothetical protein